MTGSVATTTTRAASRMPRAFLAMIAGNVCMAFGPVFVRMADVAPEVSALWRIVIGAPILLGAVVVSRQPIPRMTRSYGVTLALAGLFFAADLAAWHIGILHTRIANATLFGNTASFFFPIYAFAVARSWPTKRQIAAMLIAVAGVLLLAGRSYELSAQNLFGDMMCIVAAIAYTGYLAVLERARATQAPLPLVALVTVATIPPLGLFAWAMGNPMLPHDWTPLVLLAIGSQCLGQGLILLALGQLPSVVIGLGLMIQPVVGATIGWVHYGERLTPLDFVGAAAIAVALVLVRTRE